MNENPEPEEYIPRLGLFFMDNEQWIERMKLRAVIAGVFNLVAGDYRLNDRLALSAEASTLLFFAGDSPKIDGNNFEEIFEFRGHRYTIGLGPTYTHKLYNRPFQWRLMYRFSNRQFFNRPLTSNYITPPAYWVHASSLQIGSAGGPPSELFDFGIKPSAYLEYSIRDGISDWGFGANAKKVEQYFRGQLNLKINYNLNRQWVVVSRWRGAYVSKADRLNAISDGSLSGMTLDSFFLGDVKADRSLVSDIGLRYYFNNQRSIAARLFAYGAIYRELLISGTRNQEIFGGGIKFFGMALGKLFWNVAYGGVGNMNPDKAIVHEVQAGLSYNFIH